MATHQLAKGLASLGRGKDSMLMHVTPNEVAGLNHLAKSMGGKLTTNPHTGLPEAGFFDFFTSMLPMAAGILLAPETGGASLGLTGLTAEAAPVVAGIGVGAAVAGAKGDDPLMGGLMGGLGGYGGGNLGGELAKMGTAGGWEAGKAIPEVAMKNAPGMASSGAGALESGGFGQGMAATLANKAATAAPATFAQGMGNVGTGLKQLASPGGWSKFTSPEIGGSASQLALPVGMAALSAMQPEPIDTTDEEAKRKAEENKYRDPITGRLNLAQASPGLRLATGGSVNTNQSSISSGGIQDLYGTNDNTKGDTGLSTDGYGIGRLNTLASEGSRAKAADMFYAEGGPIAFAEGGSSDIKIPGFDGGTLNVNTGVNSLGGSDGNNLAPNMLQNAPQLYMAAKLFGMNPATMSQSDLSNLANTISNPKWSRGYAHGGPVSFAEGGSSDIKIPGFDGGTLNVNTGSNAGKSVGDGGYNFDLTPILTGYKKLTSLPYLVTEDIEGNRIQLPNLLHGGKPKAISGALKDVFNNMAQGGYLDGHGDGMSDSIPATIEGKQPARLADGEFVVPADVVSHLGNGSSKAGSKRLYAMMEKVRRARTGNSKQGKEINPNKYMPV